MFAIRKLVDTLYDYVAAGAPHNPGQDYLEDNYAPVQDEIHSVELEVEGTIPEGLDGAFMRTGPNPHLKPIKGYHWFDGDGMIHAVKLGNGKALSYANRYIITERFKQESAAGKPLMLKGGDLYGPRSIALLILDKLKRATRVYSEHKGTGTANTALLFHAQRLMALHEGDMPYQMRLLCNGIIETLGRVTLTGSPSGNYPGPFTAHPKVDPTTGELFFFGYNFNNKPYVRAGLMDAKGLLTKQWAVHVEYPTMMHDCALTPTYGILLHMPLVFDPKRMVKEKTLPFGFRDDLPSRIGLIRRDAPACPVGVLEPGAPTVEVQWFEMEPGFSFHVANAWEDQEGKVHIVACHFQRFNFHGFNGTEKKLPPPEERQHLTEYILDPATGKAELIRLSKVHVDFPVIQPSLSGLPTRFVWGATFDFRPQTVEAYGIAKFDLSLPAGENDACVAEIRFAPNCYGGEAVFVPKPTGNDGTPADEDDGWLLVFVHDNNTNRSALHIYDAKTMDPTPLARVYTPQRVPYGFHGIFVTKDQLDTQQIEL